MNDLTAEGAEGTEEERREMNNYDASGFELTQKWGKQTGKMNIIPNSQCPIPHAQCPMPNFDQRVWYF